MSTVARKPRPGRVGPGQPDRSRGDGGAARRGAGGPTVELAAYAAIIALAAGLRLGALDLLPLDPGEAANAWQSWSLLRWGSGEMTAGPLYTYGTGLLLGLFGGSDFVARLLSALLGTAMVALPYVIRRQLGREEALLGAGFLALSPTLVYFSRHAGPDVLAAALSLASLVMGVEYVRERRRGYLVALALSLGLLLASGGVAYLSISAGLIGLCLWPATEPKRTLRVAASDLWRSIRRELDGEQARAAAVAGLGAAVLVSTGALSDPSGLQRGLIDSLQGWVNGLFSVSGQPWYTYLLMLAVYETGLLVLALVSVFVGGKRAGVRLVLLAWASLSLILGTLGGHKEPGLAAQMVVPLALLSGFGAAAAVRGLAGPDAKRRALAFAITVVPLLVLLYIVINAFSLPNPKVPPPAAAAPVMALVLVLSAWIYQVGIKQSAHLLGSLAAVLVAICAFSGAINLSFPAADHPVAVLTNQTVSCDVRTLSRQAEDLANILALRGESPDLMVHPSLWPALAWYLRKQPNIQAGQPVDSPLAIVPAGAPGPDGYLGQRYRLYYIWEPAPIGWQSAWRWAVLHEAPPVAKAQDAMLYVKVP